MEIMITALLWFCAIGCGLLGGLYFAFSAFIMRALADIEPAAGAAAMNAINRVILRSAFMPLFLGSTLACAALAILGMIAGSWLLIAGGVLYVIGMFMVTMAFNVPLNEALFATAARDTAAWRDYVQRWTRWNHVRTLASTGASALFIAALQS
jgi:uncharacterized membrane protein